MLEVNDTTEISNMANIPFKPNEIDVYFLQLQFHGKPEVTQYMKNSPESSPEPMVCLI